MQGDNIDDWAQADGLDIINLEEKLDSRLAKWSLEKEIDSLKQKVQEEPPSAWLQNSETTVGNLELTIGNLSDNELSIFEKPTETVDGSIFGKSNATHNVSGDPTLPALTITALNKEVRVSEPRESESIPRKSESKPRDHESGES